MTKNPRCDKHTGRETIGACSTCLRIDVERQIIERTVAALLAAGYTLAVDDGDEETRPAKPTASQADILRELMETDMDLLRVYTADGTDTNRWIQFVYGNDGYDVIADYTMSLEDVLSPVNDFADTLAS